MEPTSKHERHARTGEPLGGKPPLARPSAGQGRSRARSGKELSRRRRAPIFAVVAVALSVLATAACGGAGSTSAGGASAGGASAGGASAAGASAAGANAGQESDGQRSTPAAEATDSAGSEGDGRDKAAARAGEAVVRKDGAGARAGEAKAGVGDVGARAGKAKAGPGGAEIAGNSGGGTQRNTEEESGPQKITLEITGDRGTEFSGVCSVGGTERILDGRAPERFVFEPQGKRLECELRNGGGGPLGIVFTDGAGVLSQQRTAGGESTVSFVYANGIVSSSTTSSSGSESQTVTSSDTSSSERSR